MDRIDAMKIFVTAVEEGSLAGAARRLRRSPTAISRAIAALEGRDIYSTFVESDDFSVSAGSCEPPTPSPRCRQERA